MNTDITNRFIEFLEEEQEAVFFSFFRLLSPEDKKQITQKIQELEKDEQWYSWQDNERPRLYQPIISRNLKFARFICYSKTEIKDEGRFVWYDLPPYKDMDLVLEWYQPEWFTGYFNRLIKDSALRISYVYLIKWLRKGHITEKPEEALPDIVTALFWFQEKPEDSERYFSQITEEYPELPLDLLSIFRYPCEVAYRDKHSVLKEDLSHGPITTLLKQYTDHKVLDRLEVLRESLAATVRNFKKEQLGWYIEFFQAMEPSEEELLCLQDDLFGALFSANSKVVSTATRIIKDICVSDRFHMDSLLAALPMLFSSDKKTVVTTALSVAETIAKARKESRNQICECVTTAFLNKNEDIQLRAARLLKNFGDKESLPSIIAPYTDMILMSAQSMLEDFLPKEPTVTSLNQENIFKPLPSIHEGNRIEPIQTMEELIFRLGQAFEDPDLLNIYLIPEALLRLNDEINGEVLTQFEPALKAAEKAISKWLAVRHFTDELLAYYFISYCIYKAAQIPEDSKPGKQLTKRLIKRLEKLKALVNDWVNKVSKDESLNVYLPYMEILNTFMIRVVENDSLPLLSTPTHTSGRIDPSVFLDRFSKYAEKQTAPASFDLQIAILRCALDDTEKALERIRNRTHDFYSDLFGYLFDANAHIPDEVEYPELWLTCAMSKQEKEIPQHLIKMGYEEIPTELLTGVLSWEPSTRQQKNTRYNTDINNWEEYLMDIPCIRVHYRLVPTERILPLPLAIAYTWQHLKFYSYRMCTDLPCFFLLYPKYTEVLAARFVHEYAQHFDSDSGDFLIFSLNILHQLNAPLQPISHLLVAFCLLFPNKTTRSYTADMWSKLTSYMYINNTCLGETLGRLLVNNNAPLKRLTDVLMGNMLNISAAHNQQLLLLVESCLAAIDGKPLRNLKKLQEIHRELVAQNK